jgi:hypothetical protein
MFLWYGMGFTLYLTKFPERFFPNRYVLIRCHMCGKLALCRLFIVVFVSYRSCRHAFGDTWGLRLSFIRHS